MKIIAMILGSLAFSIGATIANATAYNLSGTGVVVLDLTNAFLGYRTYTGSGTVDDTGGVFNSATFTYTAQVGYDETSSYTAVITGIMVFDDASGIYTDTYTSCIGACSDYSYDDDTEHGLNAYIGVEQVIDAGAAPNIFDFSDLLSLTWTSDFHSSVSALDGLPITTTNSFVASPVPVPAAVWMFGSGLLCLAGISKKGTLCHQ